MKPNEYFEYLKNKQKEVSNKELKKIYNQSLSLLSKYKATGQVEGMKRLVFLLKNVEKELELVELGYSTYVEKDDIKSFIESVSDKVVKIIEVSRYERDIPDEVVENMLETKHIFDDYFIVFTDYTGEIERKVAKERREKDPILFGVFIDEQRGDIFNRFYYLGDWEDEYCDLTLNKMVEEMAKHGRPNIDKNILDSDDIAEIQEIINPSHKNIGTAQPRGFWNRFKRFIGGIF